MSKKESWHFSITDIVEKQQETTLIAEKSFPFFGKNQALCVM